MTMAFTSRRSVMWPAMTQAIACRGLKKYYADVKAVDGLDLFIDNGECFGLLGPNGAGKPTTIEILEGLTVPDILCLDEPTTGLDPQSRLQLWEVVQRFRTKGGTVLLTTHYMEEAERLCDRVAIVDHGHLIALGTPQELIAKLEARNIIEFSSDPPLDRK